MLHTSGGDLLAEKTDFPGVSTAEQNISAEHGMNLHFWAVQRMLLRSAAKNMNSQCEVTEFNVVDFISKLIWA